MGTSLESHMIILSWTRGEMSRVQTTQKRKYAANLLAENMLSRCDEEGKRYALLKHIIDNKKDSTAITREDVFVGIRGCKSPRRTIKGWKICVDWKDDTASWDPLSGLKDSYPVVISEYAVTHGLVVEPAFSWWVPKHWLDGTPSSRPSMGDIGGRLTSTESGCPSRSRTHSALMRRTAITDGLNLSKRR
jgi:hypothetical protein